MGEAIRNWLDSLNKKIEQVDNELNNTSMPHHQAAFLSQRKERLTYAVRVLDHLMKGEPPNEYE